MTWRYHEAKRRIAGAVEYLRTGRVESFDDLERVNQLMHEGGFADRNEAYEFVADELNRLWDREYPTPWAYLKAPASHHGPWCDEGTPCATCFNLAEDARQEAILGAIGGFQQVTPM